MGRARSSSWSTGSTTTVITNGLRERLGTTSTGIATVVGTTGSADMPVARLDLVDCGVVTWEKLRIAVFPESGLSSADGILGTEMVAERRLMVNVRRKQVRVEPTRRSTRRAVANMRVCKGLLAEIDGKVGNVNACLLLDTGAQNYIADMALSDALRKHHPRLQRVDNVRVYGVTGHKVVGQFIAMPRVNLKAFHVDDAGCVAAHASIFDVWDLSRKPAMIVGVNLLSRLDRFSIDYGARNFEADIDVRAHGAQCGGVRLRGGPLVIAPDALPSEELAKHALGHVGGLIFYRTHRRSPRLLKKLGDHLFEHVLADAGLFCSGGVRLVLAAMEVRGERFCGLDRKFAIEAERLADVGDGVFAKRGDDLSEVDVQH